MPWTVNFILYTGNTIYYTPFAVLIWKVPEPAMEFHAILASVDAAASSDIHRASFSQCVGGHHKGTLGDVASLLPMSSWPGTPNLGDPGLGRNQSVCVEIIP